ncbi:phosphotransferase [Gordonia sp. NB41Y]|uniref:phosphotransferase family protein n=1 Tax=Gordonia sp. NB41Y TaxID=875808 RepID=UPI0002BF3570|nr:phosphotransferase [Gordonia sp. NB41Y]EMP14990.1 aminoglycoside phosphotransferase [Gordonia sp. NB41Y]WLP88537.1 phosphotransferase [Gordonia sp. NB41Y]
MSVPTMPRSADEITPEWLSEVLAPTHPGVEVADVEVVLRDDGTNRRARLALGYRQGNGPATVFTKSVDPAHRELIQLTSGMFHEPRLFASGATLPVDHPAVYAAVIDEDSQDFLLVMEDVVARGAQPRDALHPLTPRQAASGVRALGRLHSRYWGRRVQIPELDWLEPFVAFEGLKYADLPSAIALLDDTTPGEVLALSIDELVDDIWKPFIETVATSTPTLLHGDPHIGNTYVTANGELGLLDWQMARRGNWSLDVGYFVQGALTTADRRAHERDLLAEYRDALDLPDAEKPAPEEIWLRYRASVAHGLATWLATASAAGGLWQRVDVAAALAQRYSAAYGDLGTREAIAELTR